MSFTITAGPGTAPRARTLLDIFNATALRCGDRVAIDASDAVLSYRDLAESSRDLARRLNGLGVGPGDRVGVRVASGTSQLYVAILGVLQSGAAYVPVDAEDPPARAADIFARAGACVVVGDELAIDPLASPSGDHRPLGVSDDAWVIFTSGSTGEPKGVAVSHRSAAAFVDAEARLWDVAREDRVLAGLSVGFDASCEEIWLAWRNGAALVPAPRCIVRTGPELGAWLRARRVTVVSTVPTLAAMWDADALADVRLLILGGEACPEPLAWRLACGRDVWNTYGPTEATVVSTAARVRPGEPVTIGWPLDGWETAVLDEHGLPVEYGEPGELVVSGAGVARYLDPLLDTERFAPVLSLGWARAYCTGDIVRETAGGLVFVGRRDHQVKIGGRRIELGEIDARLSDLPGVRAAVTVVRESNGDNRLLVSYVTGDVDATELRNAMAERLPAALVPLMVVLDELPSGSSGKVDRDALPWPPPARGAGDPVAGLTGTAGWVAELWTDQLGPVQITPESDFFEFGGSSLAAAKLTSVLRDRFPTVTVADIYAHRRLSDLSARLDELRARTDELGARPDDVGEGAGIGVAEPVALHRAWGATQVLGVLVLLAFAAPPWVLGVLAFDRFLPWHLGPQVGVGWLVAGWLALVSAPGRALIVVGARRLLLAHLEPGRYRRDGWLAYRLWFVERLADVCHLDALGGTPWAARYARISGARVGAGARLGTIPPATSLVSIGAGATVEADVDLHGWSIDGQELVVGAIHIGAGARVGTRTLLMPGSSVEAGAEIEPGSLVAGEVPAGQRWAGSPARRVGVAGEGWPASPGAAGSVRRRTKLAFALGMAAQNLLAPLASLPGILLLVVLSPAHGTAGSVALTTIELAPLMALSFVVSYALIVALAVRVVSPMIRPGWHREDGLTGWALWFTESVMAGSRGLLFPLYASLYTRPWLRLLGVKVGRRTEISTAVGLTKLTRLGDCSFATDDVVFASAPARGGWLHLGPIEIGDRSFLGNSAILQGSTRLGDDSLVGVLSVAPRSPAAGTSWFGHPALELPRTIEPADRARTTDPPSRLILARGATELIRILLPATVSTMLAALVFLGVATIGSAAGILAMAAATPALLAAAGMGAAIATIAAKWGLIGRYRPGVHPLWSSFVWRDEIVNSCQEQLAGGWLLRTALATPVISFYLRLMGAKVGRGVWCESLNVTEFDVVALGDECVINRHAVVETHLFHDRLMRIGPATLGRGSTLGPAAAILPDAAIGTGAGVSGRSVVMRGEQIPAGTRWHGAPLRPV